MGPDDLARVRSAGEELHGFVDTVLSRHSASEAGDVVGRLLAGESEDRLSEQEPFASIVLLCIAGHENSTSLIGNGAAMLLGLPEVRRDLVQDPSRWPAAIEELMRLVSPNQFIRRQAPTTSTCGSCILSQSRHLEREHLSGHAAKVVECDLQDFVAPGRPFRLVANPPYALTAAVLTFVARAPHLTAADLVLQRAVVRRSSTKTVDSCAVSAGRADIRCPEAPSSHLHRSTQPSSN